MAGCPEESNNIVPGLDCMKANNNENTEEYWRSCAMQLATSSLVPLVMQAVMDLELLEIISKAGQEGVSADVLASQLKLTHDTTITAASSMLDRMLCLLAAHSILTCTYNTTSANDPNDDEMVTKTRLYSLGPVAKYFIPNSDGVSLGPFMSYHQEKILMDLWPELKSAVLEGGYPFNKLHGMPAFDYIGKDPRLNEVFNKAMINPTTNVIKEVLSSYEGFDQLHQIVDIGGGLGVTLKLITSKYPHIKGINFDLPHVIRNAPHYPGVEHVAGDMFESVPGGDAIFMKWILHDWSDGYCLKLLKNCYKSLPDEGKVIVVEGILPTIPDNTPVAKTMYQHDLIMMAITPGGKERTQENFLSLARAAGFAGIRIKCYVCGFWVMEFYK